MTTTTATLPAFLVDSIPCVTPRELAAKGCAVVKVLSHEAYPKNGNVHNATKHWEFFVVRGGKVLGSAASMKQAREIAEFV